MEQKKRECVFELWWTVHLERVALSGGLGSWAKPAKRAPVVLRQGLQLGFGEREVRREWWGEGGLLAEFCWCWELEGGEGLGDGAAEAGEKWYGHFGWCGTIEFGSRRPMDGRNGQMMLNLPTFFGRRGDEVGVAASQSRVRS